MPLAHKKLGQALAMLGRGREADDAFEEFFERDTARGKVALALNHLRAGRRPEAIELLRGALREDAKNVDAMRFLALEYWREKERLGDAEALLRRATTLAPDYTGAWILLGRVLEEHERHTEAIESYRTATQIEPGNAAAWAGLGLSYAHVGDVTESITAFERSLALRDSADVQLSYGHVLKTRGDQVRALGAYRAAIAAKPAFGEGLLEHGEPQDVPLRGRRGCGHGTAARARRARPECRHPFSLRARQGLRGSRGLRSRLELLPHRERASEEAGVARPRRVGAASRADRRGVHARAVRQARERRARIPGSDFHRRPAALWLDAWSSRFSRATAWSRAPQNCRH
jgi:tetratricopeptide (TPR) repeat protein